MFPRGYTAVVVINLVYIYPALIYISCVTLCVLLEEMMFITTLVYRLLQYI